MKIATTIGRIKINLLTKIKNMEKNKQIKDRAYKVGEFYVKNPIYNPELNEFVYELTTDVNDCHLMTEDVARYLHKMNGEGQIRIINTINK